ncbi:uncharacterized protein I303_101705 [Kwoniella dejecticola CBS 10117]|uniref:C2H2-type domain-containing protein n=1 Tax=Kwoniella dejecticola CBS 10117 TaxID=1296121 RepID=A0AAJ8KIU2_9TREE
MDDRYKPQPRVSTSNLGVGPPLGSYSAAGGTPSWRSGPSPSPTPPIGGLTPTTPLPAPNNVVPRALTERESQLVKHLSRLQFFLATAPTRWMGGEDSSMKSSSPFHSGSLSSPHPNLNRFLLPNGEHVACVFWNGLYHITGTDIVRALVFRFEAFSRPVRNMKKFEEGVFSDLRNLKPGTDACLEEPKSPFLDLLFRNGCIRTQKKVFYWFSVPHDRLFLDALERDLKREKMGLEPTTMVVGEPARSFRYDPKRSLFEQFAGKQPGIEESINPAIRDTNSHAASISATGASGDSSANKSTIANDTERYHQVSALEQGSKLVDHQLLTHDGAANSYSHQPAGPDIDLLDGTSTANAVLFSRSLLKGSPAYKQGRRKSSREKKNRQQRGGTATSNYDTADEESGSDSDRVPRSEFSFPLGGDDIAMNNSSNSTCPVPPPIFNDVRASSVNLGIPDAHQAPHIQQISGQFLSSANPVPMYKSQNETWAPAALLGTPRPHALASTPHPPIPSSSQPLPHMIGPALSNPVDSTVPLSKGFGCPLLSCGRLFKRLEHLKRHVRTHTQERPYECTRCSKRFSRSDNLTQHIKTHEKADRGERLKTEASESAEDDITLLLEAEVDAMAAREHHKYQSARHTSLNLDQTYDFKFGQSDQVVSDHSPARIAALPPPFSSSEAYSGHSMTHLHPGHTSLLRTDWVSPGNPPLLSGFVDNASFSKRHRSMTPNLPPTGRTNTGEAHLPFQPTNSYFNATRYHPYGTSQALAGSHHFTRAASLDPSALLNRPLSYGSHVTETEGRSAFSQSFESNDVINLYGQDTVHSSSQDQAYAKEDVVHDIDGPNRVMSAQCGTAQPHNQ